MATTLDASYGITFGRDRALGEVDGGARAAEEEVLDDCGAGRGSVTATAVLCASKPCSTCG